MAGSAARRDGFGYPERQTFWEGGEYLLMGSGIYYKTITLINIQVRTRLLPSRVGACLALLLTLVVDTASTRCLPGRCTLWLSM